MIPTIEELMVLKDLTRMTGTLTNVQIAQLKMWPKIILGADTAEVEFDPDSRNLTVALSNLDFASMMNGMNEDPVTIYDRRMAKFNDAVKMLLGDDYSVIVTLKGVVLKNFPPTALPLHAHLPVDTK